MLLTDPVPWRLKLLNQNQSLRGGAGGRLGQGGGGGYAPHGGALPTSPTFSTQYHESMWHLIDNGTCLVDNMDNHHDDDYLYTSSSSSSSNLPAYEWQLRAPYVILLGTMKGGTQALTSYLWQHPRFAQKDFGYEMHFFDQHDFVRNASGIPRRQNQQAYAHSFLQSHTKFLLVEAKRQRHRQQQQQQQQAHNNTTINTNHTATTTTTTNDTDTTKVPVSLSSSLSSSVLLSSSYVMMVDSSPYYLLASDRIPDAILCVAPWAKWLAILRNPISRVESHFRHLHAARFDNNKRMVNWQIWIQHDIQLLTTAGVLLPSHVSYVWNATTTTTNTSTMSSSSSWNATLQAEFDKFAGSADEIQAWKRYNRSPSSQQIVGRGLYAIQIGHYIAALQRKYYDYYYYANRRQYQSGTRTGNDNDNSTDNATDDNDDFQQVLNKKLLVITSEDLNAHTQDVYNRVLEFLELPNHVLMDTSKVHASDTTNLPDIRMPHHVRLQLQRLYEPYNQRLFHMLGWNNNNNSSSSTIWQ